jgi:hypothetical protein
MHVSTIRCLLDPRKIAATALGLLAVAPLSFGLPYLLGSQTDYGYGVVLMLLLIGPSIWAASWITRVLAAGANAPGVTLIGGCAAPLIGLFLWGLGFVTLDNLCESDSIGCGVTNIWALAALVWVATVFSLVWSTSTSKRAC